MGLYNTYNLALDANILDELKHYVKEDKVAAIVEKLIKAYIKQQKQEMQNIEANEAKIANKNKMTKNKAKALLLQKKYDLNKKVTFSSSNSRNGVYWANPNPKFLHLDWSLILNDIKNRKLYLLNIPKNTFKSENISLKSPDYELLDIRLDPNTLINTAPDKTDFSPYKIAEVSY